MRCRARSTAPAAPPNSAGAGRNLLASGGKLRSMGSSRTSLHSRGRGAAETPEGRFDHRGEMRGARIWSVPPVTACPRWPEESASTSRDEQSEAKCGVACRVLLVDDEEYLASLLAEELEAAGYEVVQAFD